MSQKRVHSNGSIPFSWEDKPGVRKTPNPNHDYSNITRSVEAIPQKSSSTLPPPPPIQDIKIPLPPRLTQPSLKPISGKGFRWQQDPFLVAYKECTKLENIGKLLSDNKKGVGSNSSVRKSKSIFSCKNSSDARDDNFLKLSQLPRLPMDKIPNFT